MRSLALLLCAALLAACSHGPAPETLQNDLQQRLQQAFPSTVLSLAKLQRRGSANDAHAPDGEKRLVVYFDATLKVEQDQDFGAWDSPGVATLVTALGAGPRGVSGIESGGNHAGDLLTVHGSLIYREQNGSWQVVVPQGFTAPRAAQSGEGGSSTRETLINAISTALHLAPGGSGPQERKAISDELEYSLANIQGRLARLENGYPLAGGPPAGQYARFAQALSELLKNKGMNVHALNTEGGLDNLRMLRRGDVALALSQSDAAYAAAHGTEPFQDEGPDLKLRTIASLYPEPVHVLVSAKSTLQGMRALRGQRVNIGTPGSASRLTALAVLAAHGLQPEDLAEVTELDLQQALSALRDNQLDALIQVIGAPADNIRAASEAFDLRLLPLEDAAISRLQQQHPGSFAFDLPQGTYPQQEHAVPTLAVSSMLLTNDQLTAREVENLVRLLFSQNNQWLQHGSIQGAQLSPKNALRNLGIPLHNGAEKALQQLQAPPSPPPLPAPAG
jgi:TRAP transporter TAXI family solute receptor